MTDLGLPKINFDSVDELISVRKQQHGGGRGAPHVKGGEYEGAVINKSCILMLSALLQGYVEEMFFFSSTTLFEGLSNENAAKQYRKTFDRWGNPSSANIERLFVRIGVIDVFGGLSWQKSPTKNVKDKLDEINHLRNKIAHGQPLPRSVSLANVENLRKFSEQFSQKFSEHVSKKLRRK